MMQAAEKAARAAMLEAAQREGIPLGPWSANARHQQVELDDQQLQFISELEQSSSNGEISGGDQHLLQEVMGLHQGGQLNFQIPPAEEKTASPSHYRQLQSPAQSIYPYQQQQPAEDLFRYHDAAHQQIPQDYFQQFLLHHHQQQSFDENSYVNDESLPALPEEHYLTIAQNGKLCRRTRSCLRFAIGLSRAVVVVVQARSWRPQRLSPAFHRNHC